MITNRGRALWLRLLKKETAPPLGATRFLFWRRQLEAAQSRAEVHQKRLRYNQRLIIKFV